MVCGVLAAPEVLLVAGLAAVSAVEVSVFSAVLLAEVGVVGAVVAIAKFSTAADAAGVELTVALTFEDPATPVCPVSEPVAFILDEPEVAFCKSAATGTLLPLVDKR